jgi:tetratricopeptide (TPR) repeat protein
MSSIIEGYNYDIFISYRQKDNKGDRWVSEFVEELKTELESTFKEEISVYFDINPHDGLLETHDVNASLKDKLKCLVFIPIISRTYCDPKSFAWEHEFKAFIEQSSKDQFGLKVKLPNGNVANRVLPVRIHDLDSEDIKLCESILGGVLRGLEFIYKESGVNKPLSSGDDERKNLNNTKYRIQLNKVANAIKEIVSGLKMGAVLSGKEESESRMPWEEVKKEDRKREKALTSGLNRKKWLSSAVLIALILVFAAVYAYPKLFRRDTLERLRSPGGRISVVVIPFQNMTNDTIWDIWQNGIQNELISSLTNSKELKVRQTESVNGLIKSKGLTNYASITPSLASSLSEQLDANVLVFGSIKEAGDLIRLNAQLIDPKTEEVFKSFQIETSSREDMIFTVIDSLSWMVKNFLILSKLRNEASIDFQSSSSTTSPEAYRDFILGNRAFYKRDYSSAVKLYSLALAIDSNYLLAISMTSVAYYNQELYNQARNWCFKVYEKKDQMPIAQNLHINWLYAMLFETPNEEIRYLRQELEIDNQLPAHYYELALCYSKLHQYDNAIPIYKKALDIYKKWDSKPMWVYNYIELGIAYHKTGQFKKEKKLYKKAEQDFPDNSDLICRQAVLSITEGDTISANRYINKYISILKNNSTTKADIATGLASIYSDAGILDEAEKYFRQALALEPKNLRNLNNLAYFLIDNGRNINEGLELNKKALESSPENNAFLHCKGWGLYKQGKYQEALEVLQKDWDLRMKNDIYNHEAYLHLEVAKNAAANKKNNSSSTS